MQRVRNCLLFTLYFLLNVIADAVLVGCASAATSNADAITTLMRKGKYFRFFGCLVFGRERKKFLIFQESTNKNMYFFITLSI